MGEKGKFHLTIKYQLIQVEGIIEIEKYHLAIIMEVVNKSESLH